MQKKTTLTRFSFKFCSIHTSSWASTTCMTRSWPSSACLCCMGPSSSWWFCSCSTRVRGPTGWTAGSTRRTVRIPSVSLAFPPPLRSSSSHTWYTATVLRQLLTLIYKYLQNRRQDQGAAPAGLQWSHSGGEPRQEENQVPHFLSLPCPFSNQLPQVHVTLKFKLIYIIN